MMAHVPSIPRTTSRPETPRPRVWTIVLTGNEPPVLRDAQGRRSPCGRGARTTPGRTTPAGACDILERASRLAPPGQMVAVLSREQAAAWDRELSAVPHTHRLVQPAYRGRAAEALLGLMTIARDDPSATVVLLPADVSRATHDPSFLRHVARAVWAVALRPDLPILVGAHPAAPVTDGWIEPGPPIEGLETLAVRSVKRFVDDTDPAERRWLFDNDALTSTSILVGCAGALLALAGRTLPEVVEALEPLDGALDRAEESLLCEAVYECMPQTDLAALERAPGVAILGLPDVVWRLADREVLGLLAS